jgi:hypothetical protein
MRTFVAASLAVLGAASLAAKDGDRDRGGNDDRNVKNILEWQVMAGVPRPYTGAANAIRGVAGGGLPWIVGSAKGELRVDGHLEIKITGLVFDPSDAGVLAQGLANQNTIPNFRAVVSCLSKDQGGAATTVNISTGLFPATLGLASSGGGNAQIEANLQLPQPCIAPIVFVTSPGGAWFASTGF